MDDSKKLFFRCAPSHSAPWRTNCLVIFALLVGFNLHLQAFDDHGREIRPASWREDATINDVFFINRTHGWAVGDQGLILRTVDGGQQWVECEDAGLDLDDHRSFEEKLARMRPITQTHELYPLTCCLKCVHFINEKQGWIVGNYYTPYLERSHSVFLKTEDGGKTWRTLRNNFLPQINRVYFQSVLGGWALGRKGSLYKSGVVTTSSGGRTWSAQLIEPPHNVIDGDLVPSGFVVIDDQGHPGKIIGKQYQPAVIVGSAPGKLRSVRMVNADIGWAVGSSGTILITRDGGQSWAYSDQLIDHHRLKHFDFTTVTIAGNRVWIAGNPGTYVISFDAQSGADIEFHETSVSLPIHKIVFAGDKHGWAVGANGLILATSDQGSNWNVQRIAEDRVGILAFSQNTQDLPFALLSNFASEKGVLSGSVIVGRHDELKLDIATAATVRVGCSVNFNVAGRVKSDQKAATVQHDESMRKLVRAIRTLRPNVLVCSSSPHGGSGIEFTAACRNAIELAADESVFPQQIEDAGLSAWQVDRFLIRTLAAAGELNLDGNQYLPRSGQLLEDQIAISRGLTNLSPVFGQTESYRVESFTGTISALRDDIFFGLKQLGRDVAKRESVDRWGNLSSIATAPLKHKEMARLVAWPVDTPQQAIELQRQIKSFGTAQQAHELGVWLMQLAEKFVQAGKIEQAAFTLEQMVNRVGNHAFTPAALMWLSQYYSSSEIGAAIYSDYKASIEDESNTEPDIAHDSIQAAHSIATTYLEDGVQKVAWKPESGESVNGTADFEESVEESIAVADSKRIELASRFLNRLKQRDPDLAQSEQIQFMEANLSRKLPTETSVENLLKRLRRTSNLNNEFAFAASRELRVREQRSETLGMRCFSAASRPLLDGKLDDELWQQAMENGDAVFQSMTPAVDNQSKKTDIIWLALDDEFLFLAARCNKIARYSYPKIGHVRTRDPDLTQTERIQLALDFDRDCQSEFLLEVDYMGRATDSCGGSPGWNPQWFVAADDDERSWSIECAIPLAELTFATIDDSTVAAFSIRRLNHDSIDLWSDDPDRTAVAADSGIVAGLTIRPKQYDLLRFSGLDQGTTDSPELK